MNSQGHDLPLGHRTSERPQPVDDALIRLRDPASVVAAVPYLVGHEPVSSLVAIGLGGGGAVGPVLRVDLPRDPGSGAPGPARDNARLVAEQVVAALLGNGCERAVVTVHVDVDPPTCPEPPVRWLLEDLQEALDLVEVVQVGPTRYRSLHCAFDDCCPAGGAARSEVRHHPVAAAFVLAGRSAVADRGGLEPADVVSARDQDAARAAAARHRSRDATPTGRERLLQRWCDVVAGGGGEPLSAALAGRLGAAWALDVLSRDAAGLACMPGGRRPATALLRGSTAGLDRVLRDPGCAGAVDGVARALRRVAALAEPEDRPVVLASHAWVAWASGAGASAALLCDRALELDPKQSLALLVARCLDATLGPPWVLQRR